MANPVSTEEEPSCPTALAQIASLLICPQCGGRIEVELERISCAQCGAQYPLRDGVPMLARLGTAENWDEHLEGRENASRDEDAKRQETSSVYQQDYQRIDQAIDYNAAYKQKLFKRWSTAREYAILKQLLASRPMSDLLLDIPCGGGRLSPQIAPFAKLLVEADIGEGQVLYGKRTMQLTTPQLWMTASAFHIPFRDASFDGVVCCRLCHHLPTAVERERLIKELLRVSKRFVIMTFFDFHSFKNTLRRLRRPFDRKPPKMTMTIARVRELARESGATLVDYPMVSPTSSGHRYALMVKD